MSRLRCRPVALLLLVLHLGACASWRPTTVAPRELIEQEAPAEIRVTRADGSLVEVPRPMIVNDSIATPTEECRTSVAAGGQYGCVEGAPLTVLALEDVGGVEVRRLNPGRTTGLIALAGIFLLVMQAAAEFDVGP